MLKFKTTAHLFHTGTPVKSTFDTKDTKIQKNAMASSLLVNLVFLFRIHALKKTAKNLYRENTKQLTVLGLLKANK
jgi:hypothetical protein